MFKQCHSSASLRFDSARRMVNFLMKYEFPETFRTLFLSVFIQPFQFVFAQNSCNANSRRIIIWYMIRLTINYSENQILFIKTAHSLFIMRSKKKMMGDSHLYFTAHLYWRCPCFRFRFILRKFLMIFGRFSNGSTYVGWTPGEILKEGIGFREAISHSTRWKH